MNKKWIWIISGIAALVILLLVLKKTGVIGKEEGTKVSTEKVGLKDITEIVTASGKVYPEIELKISPDISGEIVQLTVKEGDSVTKGQLLAMVYADIYATQRDQAAAGVNQQLAQVENASASLAAVKARMEQADRRYQRHASRPRPLGQAADLRPRPVQPRELGGPRPLAVPALRGRPTLLHRRSLRHARSHPGSGDDHPGRRNTLQWR